MFKTFPEFTRHSLEGQEVDLLSGKSLQFVILLNQGISVMESIFEKLLWNSRFVVIAAVLASLLTSLAMFYMATIDSVVMISHLGEYANISLSTVQRATLRSETVTHVVEIIDGYLLATVLLIFALGLYELFISKLDIMEEGGESAKLAGNVLVIRSLDDLKNRLAKVILMILIVKFFEHAISMDFHDAISLLYLSGGIALIGLALYLSHASEGKDGKGH